MIVLVAIHVLPLSFANDVCSDAISITSFPYSTEADLGSATADFTIPEDKLRNLTCGITTDGPGVWYTIQGDDVFLKALLTDAPGSDTKFNTALFTGSCDDLTCMAFRDYRLENQQTRPSSTWFAASGVTYYLHVAGVDPTQVGGYTLEVTVRTMMRELALRVQKSGLTDMIFKIGCISPAIEVRFFDFSQR